MERGILCLQGNSGCLTLTCCSCRRMGETRRHWKQEACHGFKLLHYIFCPQPLLALMFETETLVAARLSGLVARWKLGQQLAAPTGRYNHPQKLATATLHIHLATFQESTSSLPPAIHGFLKLRFLRFWHLAKCLRSLAWITRAVGTGRVFKYVARLGRHRSPAAKAKDNGARLTL